MQTPLILLFIFISIAGTAISLYFLYGAVLGKRPDGQSGFKNFVMSIAATGILCALLGWYLNRVGIPPSVNENINLILNNKMVLSKIGPYQSYSYKTNQLPAPHNNPALFKLSVRGQTHTIYLSCTMMQTPAGKWLLTAIKEDSLTRNK